MQAGAVGVNPMQDAVHSASQRDEGGGGVFKAGRHCRPRAIKYWV